jgi:hypothetical protein
MNQSPLRVLMESRMRRESHVRFGGRRRGNHRPTRPAPAPRRRPNLSFRANTSTLARTGARVEPTASGVVLLGDPRLRLTNIAESERRNVTNAVVR